MPAVVVESKIGFCDRCRRGSHVMCSSAACECDAKDHPNRPAHTAAGGRVASQEPPPSAASDLAEPVFERVREDPPETRGAPRMSVADSILPILADIEEAGSLEWWRVGLFPTKQGAARAIAAVRKRLGEEATGWQFKRASVRSGPGVSAMYARQAER
ncbi:MAG TPA: hypothetical protein VFJ85_02940 [Acidimicrobiales bacterium]|nr:hypothetical protein [Acidimicrobiales bacterium]